MSLYRHGITSPGLAPAFILSLAVGALGPGPVAATPIEVQPRVAADEGPDPYRAMATRASQGTPEIDGRLDEPIWELAQPLTEFVQRDPREGEPATERTIARVLYDDGALYVGIRAHDNAPSGIVGRLTRRDESSPSDWLIVSIDSYHDRRTAFEFRVNPAGVERDRYLFDDTNGDDSWDAVWDVATRIDEWGWAAEFRIPFSQLRFSRASQQVWGFNITRVIQRKNETDQWKPIPKEGSGWVSEFGELVGIRGIDPPRRLEVLPYLVTREAFAPAEDGNPFFSGSEFGADVGADIKYGVTNNLTLDISLNPDFGQVEADPSVVNLSVFETRFDEKRPFFLEGANIYDFSVSRWFGDQEQLFYSRRVGRRPQGAADKRGGFKDEPEQTTILGAAKLSGKTADGWSIGVLDAVTAEETATIEDSLGVRHHEQVEPASNYGVFRVQRDFRSGRSALGAIVTTVHRDLTEVTDFLRSSAYSFGVDGRHRFGGDNWEVTGRVTGSYVRGSEEAIEEAQRSSARYYQRPDANHLDLDPTRRSLLGSSGFFRLGKIGGGHWLGSLTAEWVTPGFEINDLGFQREADGIRSFAWVGYRELQPGQLFRSYNINYNVYNLNTFGGERTLTGMNVNGGFTLLNYWGGYAGVERNFPALNVRVLRGGPAMERPGSINAWYGFNSDDRRSVILSAGGWWWKDDARSHGGGFWADVTVRARDNLRVTLGPEYDWNHDDWKYVTTKSALGAEHYVMSVLDQRTISLTTRLDWTFTPDLSLQLYAQPFISAGDFSEFREVADPVAPEYDDRFESYGERLSFRPADEPDESGVYQVDVDRDGNEDFAFSDPNFNFKQLRSTVVLRWEYGAGSTLFLVWSQSRTRDDATGAFVPLRDLDDLLGADGENIFLMKINYYVTP